MLTWLPSGELPQRLDGHQGIEDDLSERYHCGPDLCLQMRFGARVCGKVILIAEGLEGAAWTWTYQWCTGSIRGPSLLWCLFLDFSPWRLFEAETLFLETHWVKPVQMSQ